MEKQPDGFHKERLDLLNVGDLESAVNTQPLLIGQTDDRYMGSSKLLAERGLAIVHCPSRPRFDAEPALRMSWVAVNSGEARRAIERSGADEPNRFDKVNIADAAYNAFVKELEAFTLPALVRGYNVNNPERRVAYPQTLGSIKDVGSSQGFCPVQLIANQRASQCARAVSCVALSIRIIWKLTSVSADDVSGLYNEFRALRSVKRRIAHFPD